MLSVAEVWGLKDMWMRHVVLSGEFNGGSQWDGKRHQSFCVPLKCGC